MKFCKDCIHFKPSNLCFAPRAAKHDVITGELKPATCGSQRAGNWFWNILDGDCGPRARLFQPKTP